MAHMEQILEEIRQRRDIQISTFRTISSSISRFQLIRALLLIVLSILVLNRSFHPAAWKLKMEVLDRWVETHVTHDLIKQVRYHQFKNSNIDLTESQRSRLTAVVENSGLTDDLNPSMSMSGVAKFLGRELYGVDFIELSNFDNQLRIIREQDRAVKLKDLSKYHYQGGLYQTGTNLRDNFFSEYTQQPALMEKFPYDPDRSVSNYLLTIQKHIDEIKKRFRNEREAWGEYEGRLILSMWNWYAWENLSDKAIFDWNNQVIPKVGGFDQPEFKRIGEDLVGGPDLGSVLVFIRNLLKTQAEAVSKKQEKAKLWAVELDIPLDLVLLLFPLIFFCSRAVLRSLQLRRSVTMIESAKLDQLSDSSLGIRLSGSVASKKVFDPMPQFNVVLRRDWSTLFDISPTLFSDILYGFVSLGLATLLIVKLVLVLSDPSSELFHLSYWVIAPGLIIVSILIDILSYRLAMQILATKRSEELVIANMEETA
jgi:hypothetical protein